MRIILSIFFVTYLLSRITVARAEYVLPYPSFMPGNKMYKITRIIDTLKQYWYFGPIAQQKYHLGLSDKYLVEAKTLFEYKQYLLGADALARSDKEFSKLTKATQTIEAAKKHTEVLEALKTEVPASVTWTPENAAATSIPLGNMIESSETLRAHIWQ